MRRLTTTAMLLLSTAVSLMAGCRGGQTRASYETITGGDPRVGLALIRQYNCGTCHMIPGVPNANGLVGPPLMFFSRRTFIAGELPNNTANLIRWIRSPKSVEPGTAMPTLGLSDEQARSVAAYLYTLR